MTQSKKKWTPRDLLRIVFRRRYLFLLGTAIFAFVTFVVAHHLPLKYTGTTKFERILDQSTYDVSVDDFKKERRTLRYELAGHRAVDMAAEELEMVPFPRQADGKLTEEGELKKVELINKLKAGISVRFDVRSEQVDMISVSFIHDDPESAEQMPNTLVKNYIDWRSQQTLDALEASKVFLEKQVDDAKKQIMGLQETKIRFQTEHTDAMFDSPGDIQTRILQGTTRLDILSMKEKFLVESVRELEGTVAEYQRLEATGTQPVKKVIKPNEERLALVSQYERYEEILKEELLIKKEKHPSIKHLRMRMATLKARIEKMPEKVTAEEVIEAAQLPPNRKKDLARTKRELVSAQKEIERIENKQKGLEKALANFTKTKQEFERITAALTEKETANKEWLEKLRAVRGNLAAQLNDKRTRLKTLQAAQPQTRPSSPSLWRIMALAIAGGLACGGGLVLLTNLMDRSIATTEDAVKYFNIPVHGVIGEVISHKKQSTRRIFRWALMPVMAVIIIVSLGMSGTSIYLYLKHPKTYEEMNQDRVDWVLTTVTEKLQSAFD